MTFTIGNVKLANKVVLAPMAGVGNLAFRTIAKECGAGLVCAEMVSDRGLQFGNDKTIKMLQTDSMERPLSMQIFGADPVTLAAAAKIIETGSKADIVDINMGCPVSKITKSLAGSKLLLYPEKVYNIVSAVVKAVSIPVTVKIRTGWDNNSIMAVENAKAIECAGASAVAIHGRTRAQMYEGKADWNIIAQVKKSIKIPVIGNGDVKSPFDGKEMLEITGCDAIMIGRASLGNPWILGQTAHYLETGELLPGPTTEEKIGMCLIHANRLIQLKGSEKMAIKEMRKHASWYIKGLRNSSDVRRAINNIEKINDLEILLNNLV